MVLQLWLYQFSLSLITKPEVTLFKLIPEYGYKSACDYQCLDCFLRLDLLSNFLLYFRVSVLLGVGRNFQQTYLHKGQTLDRARLFRLFSQKIICLRPVVCIRFKAGFIQTFLNIIVQLRMASEATLEYFLSGDPLHLAVSWQCSGSCESPITLQVHNPAEFN